MNTNKLFSLNFNGIFSLPLCMNWIGYYENGKDYTDKKTQVTDDNTEL
jgi:hypothetical protein